MAKILIIDDDEMLCNALRMKFRTMDHDVATALTLQDGIREAVKGSFDIVYLDVRLPDGSGLDALSVIRSLDFPPEVIIMTGQGDPEGAELAIKSGAWDYIEKPSSINTMVLPLVRALQYREIKLAAKPVTTLKRDGIIGSSPPMKACLEQVSEAAHSSANVLISGETGTGKELIAWAIHHNSPRSNRNFVVVDCASLSETLVESMLFGHEKGAYTGADKSQQGLIKQADGGTLFLDEVGELPFTIQKSFLRVLQEHRFRPLGSNHEISSDFRLVAATNRNLDEMVRQGLFRSDLLYRLRSFYIELPTLRERREDIPDLIDYHMAKICERYGEERKIISPELADMLRNYEWPGNVRELVGTLERSLAVARQETVLIPRHLPVSIRAKIVRASVSKGSKQDTPNNDEGQTMMGWQEFRESAVRKMEKQYLQELMALSGDSIQRACEISQLSRSRLYELLKKYYIPPPASS
jgi:two-component system NtrC family response regulator